MPVTDYHHEFPDKKVSFQYNLETGLLWRAEGISDGECEIFTKDFGKMQKALKVKSLFMGTGEKQFFMSDCNIPNIS